MSCPHRCIKGLEMTKWFLPMLVVFSICGCVATIDQRLDALSQGVTQGESAAVAWIYDERSGDVTVLGDRFRDRAEAALRKDGIIVKARREIGVIIDDAESFGQGRNESEIWEQAETDILVTGSYAILHDSQGKPYGRVTIKSLRVSDGSLLQTLTEEVSLPKDWAHMAAQIKGNVYQEEVETLVDSATTSGPELAVSLDRNPACYLSGTPGKVMVNTEPGSYVYLLNLAADRTVTLLYPNSIMKDQPLPTGRLQFPPLALEDDVQLVFYPLDERETIQEGIKVLASKYPFDFSFLPVPENTIYAGVQGGDIRKVAAVLKENFGWSEKVVDYWVGPDCN